MKPSDRTLVLLRHATAQPFGETDSSRVLTSRGRAEAAAAGRWLAAASFRPGRVVVSGAERTRETWRLLAQAAGYEPLAEFEDALQSAGEDSLLDLVRLTDAEVASVLLVGHNPTVSHVAQLLDDGDGEPEALHALIGGFPPGATAVYAYDGHWADLGPGTARLKAFRPGGE